MLVGDSGWRRAFAVESELEEQLANCELVASPTKTYVGAVTDSFDFLGLSLRVDRVGGGVAVEPSRSKVYEFERRIDHVIRQNLSGRRTEAGRVMTAVRDATADRLDYARRAGADLGELREFTLQRLRRWSERRGWGLDVDVIPWARVQRHRY